VVFKDKVKIEFSENSENQNMSDIFVVGYPEGPGFKSQTTDTHWRSENGEGKFNYRMKFPILMPCPTPRFKVQISFLKKMGNYIFVIPNARKILRIFLLFFFLNS
jgi:hypothetical protein